MKYGSLSAMAGLLLAASASSASAGTITLSYQSSDPFDGSSEGVFLWGPGFEWNYVEAGALHMEDQAGNPLITWCLDLFGRLADDHTYEEISDFLTTDDISLFRLNNIQSLFDMNYDKVDTDDSEKSAGFQLALWELLYENSGTYNVENGGDRGNFFAFGGSDDAIGWANIYLSNMLLDDTLTELWDLTYYDADSESGSGDYRKKKRKHHKINYQDLVSASEIPDSTTPEVPLPATAWLLGGGLAALFGIGRRRKTVEA